MRLSRGLADALAVLLLLSGTADAADAADQAAAFDVKAAFLYNFAKFVEWPSHRDGAPLLLCVIGDGRVATAITDMARGQKIDGHAIEVRDVVPQGQRCHLMFISSTVPDIPGALDAVRGIAVLTVSDASRFATGGGMIELFVERERMHFAVNVSAVQRSHLKVSSRLLGLAKIVRDGNAR